MPAPVHLRVVGVAASILCEGREAELLDRELRRAWGRCLTAPPDQTEQADQADQGDQAGHTEISLTLTLDDADGGAVRTVLDDVTTRLTREALARRVGELWLLHACAVADPDTGATIVLVAPSGTGKTTAARTLGQRWSYLTDETAAIDAEGRLTPYPKPLSLLVDGRRPKDQLSPDELGLLPAVESPRLAAIALLDRDPEVDGVEVSEIRMVEGLALLAEQTSSLHLLPSPLHLVAELVGKAGGLRRLRYAEAADLHDVVAELLGSSR